MIFTQPAFPHSLGGKQSSAPVPNRNRESQGGKHRPRGCKRPKGKWSRFAIRIQRTVIERHFTRRHPGCQYGGGNQK